MNSVTFYIASTEFIKPFIIYIPGSSEVTVTIQLIIKANNINTSIIPKCFIIVGILFIENSTSIKINQIPWAEKLVTLNSVAKNSQYIMTIIGCVMITKL